MQPIENTSPEELINLASNELIQSRREKAIEQVVQMLERIANLNTEIKNMEKNLSNKKGELEKMNGKLETLRKGDWNVLQEAKTADKTEKECTTK